MSYTSRNTLRVGRTTVLLRNPAQTGRTLLRDCWVARHSDATGSSAGSTVCHACRATGRFAMANSAQEMSGVGRSAPYRRPLSTTQSNGMDAPTRNGIEVPKWKCLQPLEPEGASAMKITTVGIDLAKNLFQVWS